jgi:hypothetical protein
MATITIKLDEGKDKLDEIGNMLGNPVKYLKDIYLILKDLEARISKLEGR